MLSLTQYLACHGITLDSIKRYLRPLQEQETLLLVGSVAEGLANPDSDLDLLLIAADDQQHTPLIANGQLSQLPATVDLNIEVLSLSRAQQLCQQFLQNLLDAQSPSHPQQPRRLSFLGADELRLLHRLRSGISLIETGNSLAQLRDHYGLHALPDFYLLQHLSCHLRLRADALQAVQDTSDPYTPLLMSQLAIQHLIAAVLATAGETNPNPKWALRLLRDHQQALHAFDQQALQRLALPGNSEPATQVVEQLLSVSAQTLVTLSRQAARSKSPITAALQDLIPSHYSDQPQDLACAI